jgi:hypothetical protein
VKESTIRCLLHALWLMRSLETREIQICGRRVAPLLAIDFQQAQGSF